MRRPIEGATVVALLLVLAAMTAPAKACSIAPPDFVDIAPRAARPDEAVPTAPLVRLEVVTRGNGEVPQYSCSDLGFLSLSLPDDATTAQVVYLFEVESSDIDASFVPSRPMHAGPPMDGRRYFAFPWIDDADDDQEPLHMKIRVTALSADGARGGSTVVSVDDPGR